MKSVSIIRHFLILLLIASCGNGSQSIKKNLDNIPEILPYDDDSVATIQYGEDPKMNFDKLEILNGWLKRGCEQKIIIDSLGEPDNKGKDEYWGGTGTYVQKWKYNNLGLILYMESDEFNENKKVFNIEIISPSTFVTSKGVGIGSTINEVLESHDSEIIKEYSNKDIIIIGSTYSGTYFYINEMKVNKIIIGTLAD